LSLAKVIQDIDIESEDPSSPSAASDDAVQSACESESRSTGTPSTSVKPMTTRQAVLASVVDSSHVSLSDSYLLSLPLISILNNLHCVDEGSKSKKQPLNETELALRREEIARKRKNLSEKKLEDEKVLLHIVIFSHVVISNSYRLKLSIASLKNKVGRRISERQLLTTGLHYLVLVPLRQR
jgi:hypothetical protein